MDRNEPIATITSHTSIQYILPKQKRFKAVPSANTKGAPSFFYNMSEWANRATIHAYMYRYILRVWEEEQWEKRRKH